MDLDIQHRQQPEPILTFNGSEIDWSTLSLADNDWDTASNVVYTTTRKVGIGTSLIDSDFMAEIEIASSDSNSGGLVINNSYFGAKTGLEINLENNANAGNVGVANAMSNSGSGNGSFIGLSNSVQAGGSGNKYGVYNSFNANSATGTGNVFGTYTQIQGDHTGGMIGSEVNLTNPTGGSQSSSYRSFITK